MVCVRGEIRSTATQTRRQIMKLDRPNAASIKGGRNSHGDEAKFRNFDGVAIDMNIPLVPSGVWWRPLLTGVIRSETRNHTMPHSGKLSEMLTSVAFIAGRSGFPYRM